MSKKLISILMVITLVTIMASGCTKSNDTGETSVKTSGNEQNGDNSSESNGEESSHEQEVKSGGVLKIGTAQNPSVIGYTPEITNNSFIQFSRCTFNSLIFYDDNGAFIPELAESWEVDTDEAVITFYLKEGIKFHDGSDFNAEAVKWNIEEYQSVSRTEVGNIESITCPDDSTVVLKLKAWRSSSLESIGFFVYYMSPTSFEENGGIEWARMNPVGTGPFMAKSFEQGVSIKYERNPNYWEVEKPYLDGIEYTIISDETTLENTLISGDIDLISYASINQLNNLSAMGIFITEMNGNGVGVESTGVIVSSAKESDYFYEAKVRQAFCYAIKADDIVTALGYGLLQRTNQWAAPGAVTYNEAIEGYDYNPEKAKELLAEAGYADGFDTTLWCPNGFENWATAIADNLNEVGIRAKVEIIDGPKAFDFMSNGWEGIFFHWASIGPDLGLYMGRHLDPDGAYYAEGIQHPEDALELLSEIRTAKDDSIKVEKELALQEKIYSEYALFGLPLYVTPVATIKQDYVKDDYYTTYHNAAWTPATAWLNK